MRYLLLLMLYMMTLLAAPDEYREIEGKHSFSAAGSACSALGKGWRIPEIWELFELRGETEHFGKDKRYWSANTLGESRALNMTRYGTEEFRNDKDNPAYAFYLQDGDITPTPKFAKANVLCTQQPRITQSAKIFKQTDEGVVDTYNEVLWEPLTRYNRDVKFDFEQAQEYCEGKRLHERTWRLPTLDELYAIIDYDHIKPAVDKALFGNMQLKYYWSDDEFDSTSSYVVGFSIGSVATSKMSNKSYVRCVSDEQ